MYYDGNEITKGNKATEIYFCAYITKNKLFL